MLSAFGWSLYDKCGAKAKRLSIVRELNIWCNCICYGVNWLSLTKRFAQRIGAKVNIPAWYVWAISKSIQFQFTMVRCGIPSLLEWWIDWIKKLNVSNSAKTLRLFNIKRYFDNATAISFDGKIAQRERAHDMNVRCWASKLLNKSFKSV